MVMIRTCLKEYPNNEVGKLTQKILVGSNKENYIIQIENHRGVRDGALRTIHYGED